MRHSCCLTTEVGLKFVSIILSKINKMVLFAVVFASRCENDAKPVQTHRLVSLCVPTRQWDGSTL